MINDKSNFTAEMRNAKSSKAFPGGSTAVRGQPGPPIAARGFMVTGEDADANKTAADEERLTWVTADAWVHCACRLEPSYLSKSFPSPGAGLCVGRSQRVVAFSRSLVFVRGYCAVVLLDAWALSLCVWAWCGIRWSRGTVCMVNAVSLVVFLARRVLHASDIPFCGWRGLPSDSTSLVASINSCSAWSRCASEVWDIIA
jgi:hypothetical protein